MQYLKGNQTTTIEKFKNIYKVEKKFMVHHQQLLIFSCNSSAK